MKLEAMEETFAWPVEFAVVAFAFGAVEFAFGEVAFAFGAMVVAFVFMDPVELVFAEVFVFTVVLVLP